MPGPELSIITVTYNSASDLRRYASRPPADVEWIVVDNNSRDDSATIAREMGARVIELPENVGFGAANNIGFEESDSALVGVINPDVSVQFRDLPTIRETLLGTPSIVAPQLLNPDGSLQPNGRGMPSIPNKILNRLSPERAHSRGFQIIAPPDGTVRPVTVIGAAFFTTRDVLRSLGGFDERFFVYYEDIDLCLRARAMGIPTILDGRVRWTHGWARAASGFNIRGWQLEFDGLIRFYTRYPRLLLRSSLATVGEAR